MGRLSSVKGTILNRQTSISVGLLALILSPLIAAIIFIAIASAKINTIERELQVIKTAQVAHIELVGKETLTLIYRRIQILEQGLSEHKEKGIYKLPHPEGAEAEFDKVYVELRALRILIANKARDRWTSADDKIFMMEFAQLNNLKMLNHKKSIND